MGLGDKVRCVASAVITDVVVGLFVECLVRLLDLADLAWALVFALLVGDAVLVAPQRSLESHARLLVLVDDRPTGQLVQAQQGLVVWSPGRVVAEEGHIGNCAFADVDLGRPLRSRVLDVPVVLPGVVAGGIVGGHFLWE